MGRGGAGPGRAGVWEGMAQAGHPPPPVGGPEIERLLCRRAAGTAAGGLAGEGGPRGWLTPLNPPKHAHATQFVPRRCCGFSRRHGMRGSVVAPGVAAALPRHSHATSLTLFSLQGRLARRSARNTKAVSILWPGRRAVYAHQLAAAHPPSTPAGRRTQSQLAGAHLHASSTPLVSGARYSREYWTCQRGGKGSGHRELTL